MSQFMRIGAEVAFGDCNVELEHVLPIHEAVIGEGFVAARAPKMTFTETGETLAYTFYNQFHNDDDLRVRERYVSVQLAYEGLLDSWQLAISRRTMDSNNRYANRLERYKFETYGSHLLQAKKEVYLILASNVLAVDPDFPELTETVTKQYRMYEKSLQEADCEAVELMVRQAGRLSLATRR